MVRMFNDSAFIASARVQISEQINQCLNDLGGLNSVVKNANIAKLDDNGLALINEVKNGITQISSLLQNANTMLSNIEHFLISDEFPTSQEMQESIKNSGADAKALDELDEYKQLSQNTKLKFAFIACNYELISRMLDSASELSAVLLKATNKIS